MARPAWRPAGPRTMTCEVMSERPGVVHTLAMNPAFGPLLRDWRETRRMTQEQLAFAAEVSTRHVSFVENGRTQPSRQMVLLLATVRCLWTAARADAGEAAS